MIVIRSNQNAEKYQGVTAHFKIWSDCTHCYKRYSQEYFGSLPTSRLSDICNACKEELEELEE